MDYFLGDNAHTAGDHRCCECYRGFPGKCLCGGLIHCQFIRENWKSEPEVIHGCDKCGDKFKFPGQLPRRGGRRKFRDKKH